MRSSCHTSAMRKCAPLPQRERRSFIRAPWNRLPAGTSLCTYAVPSLLMPPAPMSFPSPNPPSRPSANLRVQKPSAVGLARLAKRTIRHTICGERGHENMRVIRFLLVHVERMTRSSGLTGVGVRLCLRSSSDTVISAAMRPTTTITVPSRSTST
jgi:hypothetical protein